MIDLRSDTVTKPTAPMRAAMSQAEVGDDQREGDPTTGQLERMTTELLGMDGALYVPSGTMANLIAVLIHTRERPGMILESTSHIATVEAAGIAALTHARPYPLEAQYGVMASSDVNATFDRAVAEDIPVGLISIENTHNNSGGTVVPESDIKRLITLARERGSAVHVDGARIFNASVALGIPAAKLVEGVDSVMFCISKGLGAPVGSVLCGKEDFISRASAVREWCGGAMRQSGVIAAAGIVGLRDYPARFAMDHANAHRLAKGLSGLAAFKIDMRSVQTNMVYVRVTDAGFAPEAFEQHCYREGVWVKAHKERIRFVLHHQVSSADVDRTTAVVKEFFTEQAPKMIREARRR